MKVRRFRTIMAGTLAAIAASVLFHTSIARAAGQAAIRMNFDKCFVPVEEDKTFGGYYKGTVTGDLGDGDLTFHFASAIAGDKLWQFSGIYTIAIPNQDVISAFAAGIDNLRVRSGHDVLNGVVLAGEYVGAQVQVRADDYNEGLCSRGTITITPIK